MGVKAARIVFPPPDREEIAAAITDILATGALTLGPYTRQFEEAFGAAHGAQHAVATSSGTSALEISLRAIGVAGRDVVVPANTFYATAAAVLRAGARPVFADIDAATFLLSPDTVTPVLTPDTAAVVVVHVGGLITPEIGGCGALLGPGHLADRGRRARARLDLRRHLRRLVRGGLGLLVLPDQGRGLRRGRHDPHRLPEIADEARVYRDQGKGSFGATTTSGTATPGG